MFCEDRPYGAGRPAHSVGQFSCWCSNTLMDMLRIMFEQISGHPGTQSSRRRKLTLTLEDELNVGDSGSECSKTGTQKEGGSGERRRDSVNLNVLVHVPCYVQAVPQVMGCEQNPVPQCGQEECPGCLINYSSKSDGLASLARNEPAGHE